MTIHLVLFVVVQFPVMGSPACTTNMVDILAVAGTWITVSVQLHPF